MTVAEVLKAESGKSTVTAGYTSGYSLKRDAKVIGFVQARIDQWRLIWSVFTPGADGSINGKSSTNLTKLVEPLGSVDLTPTEIENPDAFFRSVK
jgi:hypothetical protein